MYEFLLTNEHGGNNELTGGAYDSANTFQWRTWVNDILFHFSFCIN